MYEIGGHNLLKCDLKSRVPTSIVNHFKEKSCLFSSRKNGKTRVKYMCMFLLYIYFKHGPLKSVLRPYWRISVLQNHLVTQKNLLKQDQLFCFGYRKHRHKYAVHYIVNAIVSYNIWEHRSCFIYRSI